MKKIRYLSMAILLLFCACDREPESTTEVQLPVDAGLETAQHDETPDTEEETFLSATVRLTDEQIMNTEIRYHKIKYGPASPYVVSCSPANSVEVTALPDMDEMLRGSGNRFFGASEGVFLLAPFAAEWDVYTLLLTDPVLSYKYLYDGIMDRIVTDAKLLSNGYCVVQKLRYYEIINRHGETLPFEFDYGQEYIIGENSAGLLIHPQYSPVNIFYMEETEEYITVFSQSRYAGETESRTNCLVRIAINDMEGRERKRIFLEDLYFQDTYSNYDDHPYLANMEAYYDGEHTLFVRGEFSSVDDVQGEYSSVTFMCIAVNLEQQSWEVITEELFFESLQEPLHDLPFIIDLCFDGTRVYSKEDETEQLAFLPGDYVPVSYSLNRDGSWQLVLCSHELFSPKLNYVYPYQP